MFQIEVQMIGPHRLLFVYNERSHVKRQTLTKLIYYQGKTIGGIEEAKQERSSAPELNEEQS